MEFDDVVRWRRSTRNFSRKRVSWKEILDAIDVANQGPFSANHNHLKYLIVEDGDKISVISELCEQDWIANASTVILICSDDAHLERVYGDRGRVYSRQQAGAAIGTFLLKLADLGIDSCWVGAYDDQKLKIELNIPKNVQIEAVIPVGYAEVHERKKNKKSLEWSLFWEEWGQVKRPGVFQERKIHPGVAGLSYGEEGVH